MPKVSGKVIKAGIKDSKMLALIQLNGKLPKIGESIICKWGRTRSLSQNALYWVFLDFLMNDCGMKDEYSTSDELHETFKAAFLSKKRFGLNGQEFLQINSTTTLGKLEFGEYLEKINKACIDWFGIETSLFWKDYQENFGGV
jgi:hypothetical protein